MNPSLGCGIDVAAAHGRSLQEVIRNIDLQNFVAMALRDQVAPPTMNLTEKDPDCDLDYVPNTAREKKVNCMLKTSSGLSEIGRAS